MLLVPVTIAPSPIHGLGVFAARLVRRGEVVSCWTASDIVVHPSALDQFSHEDRAILQHFGYVGRDGLFRLALGAERYINHSVEPNLVGDPGAFRLACRDIAAGEELVEDYGEHEPGWSGYPHSRQNRS